MVRASFLFGFTNDSAMIADNIAKTIKIKRDMRIEYFTQLNARDFGMASCDGIAIF